MKNSIDFMVIANGEGKPIDDGTGRRYNLIVASAHSLEQAPPLPEEGDFIKGPDVEDKETWWRVRQVNYKYRSVHSSAEFVTEITVQVEMAR